MIDLIIGNLARLRDFRETQLRMNKIECKFVNSSCNEKFTLLIQYKVVKLWVKFSSQDLCKKFLSLSCLTYVKFECSSFMKNLTSFCNFAKACLRF